MVCLLFWLCSCAASGVAMALWQELRDPYSDLASRLMMWPFLALVSLAAAALFATGVAVLWLGKRLLQ